MTKHKESGHQPAELLTPTSISMKNAFIIKNADVSFDHYYQMMKKRRGGVSPTKGGHSPTKGGHGNFGNTLNQSPKLHKEEDRSKVKIVCEKQPAGRDGHTTFL